MSSQAEGWEVEVEVEVEVDAAAAAVHGDSSWQNNPECLAL
jgi:hypothetical protein